MPIRNPFRRAAGGEIVDETRNGAERSSSAGAGARPVDIKEHTEYKLSEINDSGVYLPPSPTTEKPSFWHSRSNASTTSSNHRSLLSEAEPFNMSRESFDSYRRSFDISARAPVPDFDGRSRQSLDARQSLDTRRSFDARRSRALPRSSLQEPRIDRPGAATAEDGFEEVGLNDEVKPVKKRGIFARFGDNSTEQSHDAHHGFFTGRKRGQSGQGSELRPMSNPSARATPDVAVESR